MTSHEISRMPLQAQMAKIRASLSTAESALKPPYTIAELLEKRNKQNG